MIEIFKTNVKTELEALVLTELLQNVFVHAKINFDLEDCDRILRVDGISSQNISEIICNLKKYGYRCEILH